MEYLRLSFQDDVECDELPSSTELRRQLLHIAFVDGVSAAFFQHEFGRRRSIAKWSILGCFLVSIRTFIVAEPYLARDLLPFQPARFVFALLCFQQNMVRAGFWHGRSPQGVATSLSTLSKALKLTMVVCQGCFEKVMPVSSNAKPRLSLLLMKRLQLL